MNYAKDVVGWAVGRLFVDAHFKGDSKKLVRFNVQSLMSTMHLNFTFHFSSCKCKSRHQHLFLQSELPKSIFVNEISIAYSDGIAQLIM